MMVDGTESDDANRSSEGSQHSFGSLNTEAGNSIGSVNSNSSDKENHPPFDLPNQRTGNTPPAPMTL